MKTNVCIFAILLAFGLTSSWAQNTWVQKANFGGTGRYGAVGFSINGKGYMGCGYDFNSGHKNDFWQYDPGTNAWTQKANFGGLARETPVGFAIGSKGYIGTGYHFGGDFKDFYEYDSASNTWTQKADFGGTARNCATGFSIESKGYIGTGGDDNGIETKDFWEYDPSLNSWTQKADFGGAGRHLATAFAIGGKGYIGTGQDNSSGLLYEDIWEYDPSTDTWNQKANFGGGTRSAAGGFSIGGTGYIAMGGDSSGNKSDLWQYNPLTNLWTQKADFPGTARSYFATFTIGGNGYIGIGDIYPRDLRDFWEYIPEGPVATLSTTSLSFDVQLVQTRSVPQTATLTNTGIATLNISSLAATGDFLQRNTCGSSLPVGASCTIQVAFRPYAKGVRTGTVTITDDAADSPQTIALTGIGTVVQVSPSALDFGRQAVGTTSDPQTVTITNTSRADLHLHGVGILGANFGDFAATTTCGSMLVGGGSCTFDVTFTPTVTGGRHASLSILDDGGGSPQAVPLRGTGF